MEWLKDHPLKRELMDQKDMDRLVLANSVEEVIAHLSPAINEFYSKNSDDREN